MFPKQIAPLTNQSGSALVIGIFVITVMFAITAALLNVLGDADDNVTLEVWGIRALFAANSGADAALAQLFPVAGNAATTCSAVSSDWVPPAVVGFSGCKVKVQCALVSVNFDNETINQFRLTSNAVCESGACSADATDGTQCLRVNRTVEVLARVD